MNFLFDQFYIDLLEEFLTIGLKCMLLTSDASEIGVTSSTYTDVQGYEISNPTNFDASQYTPGGITIPTTGRELENNQIIILPDVSWAGIISGVRYAIIYKSDSPYNLIAKIDFQEDKSSTNNAFTVRFNDEGFITFS